MSIGDNVAIYTKGLADYIVMNFPLPSAVIGFNSKEVCDAYAPLSAAVFAANGVKSYQFNEGVALDDILKMISEKETCAGVFVSVEDNILSYTIYDAKGEVADFDIVNPNSVEEVRIGDYKAGVAAGCIALI